MKKLAHTLVAAASMAIAASPISLAAQSVPVADRAGSVGTTPLGGEIGNPGSLINRGIMPYYDLVQVTVKSAKMTREDFSAATGEIRSCGDARILANSIDARVMSKRNLHASNLPMDVRDALRNMQTGEATGVFDVGNSRMSVLVLCSRDR